LQLAINVKQDAKGAVLRIVENGAIEALINCMHRHPDNARVQEAVGK
jgi:hypothetical protein